MEFNTESRVQEKEKERTEYRAKVVQGREQGTGQRARYFTGQTAGYGTESRLQDRQHGKGTGQRTWYRRERCSTEGTVQDTEKGTG
jgi:hypothetical protein